MTETSSSPFVRTLGYGDSVLLVHGNNTADPELNWSQQYELAERYRLLIVHRRGYGQSPIMPQKDFDDDVQDIIDLMGEKAHLVGLSYGGIITLLTAAIVPERVQSLTVIEPPAFQVARGHPEVDTLLERMNALYDALSKLTPEEYILSFVNALGEAMTGPIELAPQHRKGIETTMKEPRPWAADLPLEVLASAPFPKLVVSGQWHPAFEIVADELAQRLHAERLVIAGAGHGVQGSGKPFNERLEKLMRSSH